MDEKPTLFVCDGDDGGPKLHPCRRAQEAMRAKRIEYDKVFTNAADHSEVRREHWTASVTYVFADHVANEALSVNPLGLTIVRFRTDQAFS